MTDKLTEKKEEKMDAALIEKLIAEKEMDCRKNGDAHGFQEQPEQKSPNRITVFDSVDSTNSRIKEIAAAGAPHGTVIIAETQTEGRGRLGRTFVSPGGSGIYMSVLLRTGDDFMAVLPITAAAAVAVCESVRNLTGKNAGIKWVNDIYVGGKKICGILAEAVSAVKTGRLDSTVIGIGLNFRAAPERYPDDIKDRIGWIYAADERGISRNELAADIIFRLMKLADNLSDRSFMEIYRSRSVVIGRRVRCIRGNDEFEAYAVDIDENGGLMVDADGERRVLNSGEISVRYSDNGGYC